MARRLELLFNEFVTETSPIVPYTLVYYKMPSLELLGALQLLDINGEESGFPFPKPQVQHR